MNVWPAAQAEVKYVTSMQSLQQPLGPRNEAAALALLLSNENGLWQQCAMQCVMAGCMNQQHNPEAIATSARHVREPLMDACTHTTWQMVGQSQATIAMPLVEGVTAAAAAAAASGFAASSAAAATAAAMQLVHAHSVCPCPACCSCVWQLRTAQA